MQNKFMVGVIGQAPQTFVVLKSHNLREPFSEDDAENLVKNILVLLSPSKQHEMQSWLIAHTYDGRI